MYRISYFWEGVFSLFEASKGRMSEMSIRNKLSVLLLPIGIAVLWCCVSDCVLSWSNEFMLLSMVDCSMEWLTWWGVMDGWNARLGAWRKLRWQAQQIRVSASCVRLDRTGLDLVSGCGLALVGWEAGLVLCCKGSRWRSVCCAQVGGGLVCGCTVQGLRYSECLVIDSRQARAAVCVALRFYFAGRLCCFFCRPDGLIFYKWIFVSWSKFDVKYFRRRFDGMLDIVRWEGSKTSKMNMGYVT
jgi:hypothetical protein